MVTVPTFDHSDFLVLTAVCAAAVLLMMGLVAVLAKRTGKVSVVDTIWGLGFVLVAVVSAVFGLTRDSGFDDLAQISPGSNTFSDALDDHRLRVWLLLAMVTIWGLRLAWHLGRRSRGAKEDPRYEELLGRGEGGILRKVLLPQGLAMWFVSLPVQVAVLSFGTLGWITWVGVALWLLGLLFESVGDAQLAAYKRDPERGPVMDKGLWAWTRHPNYFGDACVWWGIWLVAVDASDAWPGMLAVLAPIAMTWFLVRATGARLLEKTMMQRPGYPEYAARTSMFFPLPPKKG